MLKNLKYFLLILPLLLLSYTSLVNAYDPNSAVAYSDIWNADPDKSPYKKKYNVWYEPQIKDPHHWYNNYNSIGGDCANFVSQCLIVGGIKKDLNKYLQANSGIYDGPQFTPDNPDTGATADGGIANGGESNNTIRLALELENYIRYIYHAQFFYGMATSVIKPGDIYFHKNHAMIIATGSGESSTYNARNSDRYHAQMWPSGFNSDKKLYHMVPTVPHVKKVEIFQGLADQGPRIYTAEWAEYPADPQRYLMPPNYNQRNLLIANGTTDLTIRITFNESIAEEPDNPNVVVRIGSVILENIEFNNIRTICTGTLPKSAMANGSLDDIQLVSIDASNYASTSNQLDAYPATVAQWHESTRSFVKYENMSADASTPTFPPIDDTTGGTDTFHKFIISTQVDEEDQDIMHYRTSDRIIGLDVNKQFMDKDISEFKFNKLFYISTPLMDTITYMPVVYCTPIAPYQGVGSYLIKAFAQDLDDPPMLGGQINPDNIRKLYYTLDDPLAPEAGWQSVDMAYIDQPDIINDEFDYEGSIADLPDATQVNYYIVAIDKDGYQATAPYSVTSQAKPDEFYTFTVDKTPPVIELALSNNPFSPNGDGTKDTTLITFSVDDTSDFVSQFDSWVEDAAGNRLATLLQQDFFVSNHSDNILWDGQDLADGRYKVKVAAIDRAYNQGTQETDMILDKTAPSLFNPRIAVVPGNLSGTFTSRDTIILPIFQTSG